MPELNNGGEIDAEGLLARVRFMQQHGIFDALDAGKHASYGDIARGIETLTRQTIADKARIAELLKIQEEHAFLRELAEVIADGDGDAVTMCRQTLEQINTLRLERVALSKGTAPCR